MGCRRCILNGYDTCDVRLSLGDISMVKATIYTRNREVPFTGALAELGTPKS